MPYSQFLRIRRICSSIDNFDTHAINMGKDFIRRGYPEESVSQALIKARRQNRDDLLLDTQNTEKRSNDNVFAISTYQPEFTGLKDTIKKNWDFLTKSNNTKDLHENKIIFDYRRNKNLRDILVQAKLVYPKPTPENNSVDKVAHRDPCKTKNCRYCPKIDTTGRIQSFHNKREYSSKFVLIVKAVTLFTA